MHATDLLALVAAASAIVTVGCSDATQSSAPTAPRLAQMLRA